MIKIECYSRLNFGLIDLSKSPFRIDGGSGLALNLKAGKIELQRANDLNLNFQCVNKERCRVVVERCLKKVAEEKVSLNIESFVDSHVGLGSGTQLAMGIVKAFDMEYELNMSVDEMAFLAGSGGTSNIGIYSFVHGGFNLDSGRLFSKEKNVVGPGEQFSFKKISPLLIRMDMPEWYLCIVIPKIETNICGLFEKNLFQEYTPIKNTEVDTLCKWILTGILPSIKNKDFNSFCYSLECCMKYGFKLKEIKTYGTLIYDIFKDMKSKGANGVGMSSFGPAVFGFYETYDEAAHSYELLIQSNQYDKVYLTTPRNKGANILKKYNMS